MDTELIALWLAALPLMGSPGPATISLAAIGSAFGLRAGLAYLGGIMAGTFGVLVMIASGVTALVLAEPALVSGLTAAAALYILYLAWRIATAPVGIGTAAAAEAPGFAGGLVLALANPKAFAAIGAVYAGRTLVGDDLMLDTLAKIAAIGVVIVVVNGAWLGFGASFARVLDHPVRGRIANIAFALMLLAAVGLAWVAG